MSNKFNKYKRINFHFFNDVETEFKEVKFNEIEPFCNELKILLINQNVDIAQLAELTSVSEDQLYPLYNNVKDLDFEVLNTILESLKIKVIINLEIDNI